MALPVSIVIALILLALTTGCATSTPPAAPPPTKGEAKADNYASTGRAPAPAAIDDPMMTLAIVRITRQVKMVYKLDLREHNTHTLAMAQIMREHDERVRSCYTDRLDDRPRLRGEVTLSFRLLKATGTMSRIARASGSLDDKPLLKCIKRRLALLPFNPPRDMKGTLSYVFDVVENVASSR